MHSSGLPRLFDSVSVLYTYTSLVLVRSASPDQGPYVSHRGIVGTVMQSPSKS